MAKLVVKIRPVDLPHGPRETMAKLRGDAHHALLESALTMAGQAQWSYVAGPARATLYTDVKGTRLERAQQVQASWPDPFAAIASICEPADVRVEVEGEIPEGLGFVGGWVGVLGYDAARHVHRLPELAVSDPELPQMWWMAVDQVLAFHHATGQWWQCTVSGTAAAYPWSSPECEATWDR